MNTGKQPAMAISPLYRVVREFRSQRMYLAQFYTTGNGYRWVSDVAHSQTFTLEQAMTAVERASRDWGTACAVIDTDDNLLQPAVRQSLESRVAMAMRDRMAREVAAAGNARALRQAYNRPAQVTLRHKSLCACDHCEGLRGGAQS